MKIYILLFLFTSINLYSQQLHHHMISAQGASVELDNGLHINQTIGQQSLIGTYNKKGIRVSQGFQQAYWNTLTNNVKNITITTDTYPNPFIDNINFRFSYNISDPILVTIFDILGRVVFQQQKSANNKMLSIELSGLSVAEYLIKLSAPNYIYYTRIIKK